MNQGSKHLVAGAALLAACIVSAPASAQRSTLVSHTATAPTQAIGSSATRGVTEFVASADGRYVAFVSTAQDVVAGQVDENSTSGLGQPEDVFLWDRQTGSIDIVSHRQGDPLSACGYVHPTATPPANIGGRSRLPSISGDGRYVAFVSDCSDLISATRSNVTGASGATYLYDRTTRLVELVSRCAESCGSPAQQVLGSAGGRPFVSADGRYVLFDADMRVRVGDEASPGSSDFFIRDRTADTVRLVHHLPDDAGRAANRGGTPYPVASAVMPANAGYVFFVSGSTNIAPGLTGSETGTTTALNVFVYDIASEAITLATHRGAAPLLEANGDSAFPAQRRNVVSADGRYLVYSSRAADLVGGPLRSPGAPHGYVYDRVSNTSRLVDHVPGLPTSVGNGSAADTLGGEMVINDSGQWIAHQNSASDLVAGATVSGMNLYLFNQSTGSNQLLTHRPGQPLVSVTDGARRADPLAQLDISADGRYIAYASTSAQLVEGQNGGTKTLGDCPTCLNDVFLYDRIAQAQLLVSASVGTEATEANGHSGGAAPGTTTVFAPVQISDDGVYVSYLNTSSNLSEGQNDVGAGGADVFSFDRTAAPPPAPPPASTRNPGSGGSLSWPMLAMLFAFGAFRWRRHRSC